MNFEIFLVFRNSKNEYFLSHEDFVDIFWGHHKGVIYMRFRMFS